MTAQPKPLLHTALLNPIDRIVAFFSPRAGLDRLGARAILARAHEASAPSRLRKHHRSRLSPDQIVSQGAESLRTQARHLERNHDLARGILRTMANNIVGPTGIGIEPQPRLPDGTVHTQYATALRAAYADWCLKPEVTQTFEFAALQRLCVKTWLRDGEYFAQQLLGPVANLDHGTRVPYSLEVFESDMVPLTYDAQYIRQGIERNAWGKSVAYWVYKSNPLEAASNWSISPGALKRITADRIIHVALRDRIGQLRGISEFASIITRLEDIKEYEEAERAAAKIAASLTVAIKKTSPSGYQPQQTVSGESSADPEDRSMKFTPGMIIDGLAIGEDISVIDSNRPNPNLMGFRQGQLRAVAAGVGASYSSIARAYDGTYSAQRQELVEQWVNYASLTDEFTSMFIQPIWASFVQAAALSGVVPIPKDVLPGTEDDALYIAQSMPWIDPMKEAAAYTALVKAGFASEVEVMRRRGVNPADVLEQVKQWRQKVRDAGLVFDSDAANELLGKTAAFLASGEGQPTLSAAT